MLKKNFCLFLKEEGRREREREFTQIMMSLWTDRFLKSFMVGEKTVFVQTGTPWLKGAWLFCFITSPPPILPKGIVTDPSSVSLNFIYNWPSCALGRFSVFSKGHWTGVMTQSYLPLRVRWRVQWGAPCTSVGELTRTGAWGLSAPVAVTSRRRPGLHGLHSSLTH